MTRSPKLSMEWMKDVTPGPRLNRINRRLIPISYNLFSGSTSLKNSKIKRA
jgi:hypothetical protein